MKVLLVASRLIRDKEETYARFDRYIHLKDVIEITKPSEALTAGAPKWYVSVRTKENTYYLGAFDSKEEASAEVGKAVRAWEEI